MRLGSKNPTLRELRSIARDAPPLELDPAARDKVRAALATVEAIVASGKPAYGINTGFGRLSQTRIPAEALEQLQLNIVLSHAAGTGPLLDDATVRLILSLKVISLAAGHSGVRPELIELLLQLYNRGIHPCIPAKGSVGASGDLAPLAHLSLALLGIGDVRVRGVRIPAASALKNENLKAIKLAPKEGLALLNGTQVSTALALTGLFAAEDVFAAALAAGSLSVDAAAGSDTPFDARIHELRGQPGQQEVARFYAQLLKGSEIRRSHLENDPRVQDPYSLRCQPQVMGACLDQMRYAAGVFEREAAAVTDNPLLIDGEILSGGNFHAEPVALAADALAVAIAEIGALSERRIALLIDPSLSGLPPFLVEHGGVNSGFMIAHVTAAALASENKSLAHPSSVDSLPTSANQEDHVSMATHAARRLLDMADNTAGIVAIELLCAAHGVELLAPLTTSAPLRAVQGELRQVIPPHRGDRFLAPDIAAAKAWVQRGAARGRARELLPSER